MRGNPDPRVFTYLFYRLFHFTGFFMNKLMIFLLPVLMLGAAGCTPIGLATGVGASAGIASAKEGGISGAVNDKWIQTQINDAWIKYDIDTFAKLDTTVEQGRVLITGVVQNPDARVEAVRLAWQVKGVKQVINEIRVANSEGFQGFVRDKWISTRLRGAILFDRNVDSIHYTIDTVQGVVYLMGVARDQAELDRVIETARTVPHVKQVVSYVKMPGEKISGGVTSTESSAARPSSDSADSSSGFSGDAPMDITGPPGRPASVEAVPLD
jgi:osmotically-inducible protein OsmY